MDRPLDRDGAHAPRARTPGTRTPGARRRRPRLLPLATALATTLAITATAIVLPARAAHATSSSDNFATLQRANNPHWMAQLSDDTLLSDLSVPGTHESLSNHGLPGASPNQEDFGRNGGTLTAQLQAGVRAFDIRVRSNRQERFEIFHGEFYQEATFDDVLRVFREFLGANPKETLLLSLKAECRGWWARSCTDEPDANQTIRNDIFQAYLTRDDNARYFYEPSVVGSVPADPNNGDIASARTPRPEIAHLVSPDRTAITPRLGQVRGKIVMTQFRGPGGGIYAGYGLADLTGDEANTYIQDDFNVPTIFDIDDKWDKVRAHLVATNADTGHHFWVNYTSGMSTGAYPYTVAGGTGAGTVPGVNWFLMQYLTEGNAPRTGVLMMDYPGGRLVDTILTRNCRYATAAPTGMTMTCPPGQGTVKPL